MKAVVLSAYFRYLIWILSDKSIISVYMWDVSCVHHLLLTVCNAYCFNHVSFDIHRLQLLKAANLQSAAVFSDWFHPQTGQRVDMMCGEL